MTHESTLALPVAIELNKAVFAPETKAPAEILRPSPPLDSEQVRALEAVFAAKERESNTVSGLLGLWTSTMALHDLALEAFAESEDESEAEEEPNQKDEPELP
jgi:hypothetical protein